jgi:hypothetical protein
MPDYGGRGASWRNASYRSLPLEVPEILHKTAGPASTVKRFPTGNFDGLGAPIELYTPFPGGTVATGDPRPYDVDPLTGEVIYSPDWELTDTIHVDVLEPAGETIVPETAVEQSFNFWPLALLAGAVYLLSGK